mmetsp:Transcript_14665/g.40767  ORF Transcript_14665/g.40767 Transcript_14665/m.40767 type:complete len:142 (-) Transcript_14665:2073-2498(-)
MSQSASNQLFRSIRSNAVVPSLGLVVLDKFRTTTVRAISCHATTITSAYGTSASHTVMEESESSLKAFERLPRSAIYERISDTIGRTPVVRLQHMSPREGVDVFVKLESENPGGSVKDRLALGVIEWAEKHGELKPGQTSA